MSTRQRSAFSAPRAARLLPFIGMVLLFGCEPDIPTGVGETVVRVLHGTSLGTRWLAPIVFVDGVRVDGVRNDEFDVHPDQIESVRVVKGVGVLEYTQDRRRAVIFITLKHPLKH